MPHVFSWLPPFPVPHLVQLFIHALCGVPHAQTPTQPVIPLSVSFPSQVLQTWPHSIRASVVKESVVVSDTLLGGSDPIQGGWLELIEADTVLFARVSQGILPDLIELVCHFPLDVETPTAQQQLRQYCHCLQQVGPLGFLRGEQLRLALGYRSRKAQFQHCHLAGQTTLQAGQEPLQRQKKALVNLMAQLETALIDRLEQDPGMGKELFLNKAQQPYPRWIQCLLRGISLPRKIWGRPESVYVTAL